MASQRDLRTLLKPLFKRRPDLALVDRMVIIHPVTHYLRGVDFDWAWSHTGTCTTTFVNQLYNGLPVPHWTGAPRTGNPGHFFLHHGWKDDWEAASQVLCAALENKVLPSIEDMTDHVRHLNSPYRESGLGIEVGSPRYIQIAALGAAADGDFDLADRELERFLKDFEFPMKKRIIKNPISNLPWRLSNLLHLIRTDRSAVPALLHKWEAMAVTGMKLNKYWKPTPFPCERIAAEPNP